MRNSEEKPLILAVDDEEQIIKYLTGILPMNGYRLKEARTGTKAVSLAKELDPDLILLDLGLPDIDGIEITAKIREWSEVPIIILSARWDEKDKVAALDAGADDYLTKPFGTAELLARIRAVVRRGRKNISADEKQLFETKALKIDFTTRKVVAGGVEVHLTPIEYKLLTVLVRNAGKVLTHQQLLKEIWGLRSNDFNQYLRVYMAHLRRKLESDPANPKIFDTEVGIGYRLIVED